MGKIYFPFGYGISATDGSYNKLTFMELQQIMKADYLDIIYDNRNKAYGGYELRRNYERRAKKAAMFALLGVVAIASFSFIIASRPAKTPPEYVKPTVTTVCDLQPVKKVVIPPRPVVPPPAAAPKSIHYSVPVITTDDVKPDEALKPVGEITGIPGPANHDGDSTATGLLPKGSGGTTTVIAPPTVPKEIPVFVEQMPRFNGDLNAYLSANLLYPEQAKAAGIQGKVGIQFVVNEDGSISNLKVVRSLGAGCDEEALRVLSGMPQWKPGKNNGIPVKVLFTQPIVFRLE